MKKVWFAAFAAAALMIGISSSPAEASGNDQGGTDAKLAKISIEGATCGGCANAIVKAAKKFEGLDAIKIDQEKWVATVTFKEESKTDDLVKYLGENTRFKFKTVN